MENCRRPPVESRELNLAIELGGSCPSGPWHVAATGVRSLPMAQTTHVQIGGGGNDGEADLRTLSKRESEVLAATALGLTNRETAARLGVSVHAVKFHLAGVYRKLRVANRTQAVAMFVSAKPGLPDD